MYKQDKPRFSLKDELFNKETMELLAQEIGSADKTFDKNGFVTDAIKGFKIRELKERITFIAELFDVHLNGTYREKLKTLLAALPDELDPSKQDDDFGKFIHAPHSRFVALYGNSKEDLDVSLKALREMTKRFSAEFAIRTFIREHYDVTIAFLKGCASDSNYHVRRLASEGTRPKLPWAEKIPIKISDEKEMLDILYSDKTRYVTRSVANHLNDIYKTDSSFVYETLSEWKKEAKQNEEEFEWLTRHALRNALAIGEEKAIRLLGYKKPNVSIDQISQSDTKVSVGDAFEFTFRIHANGNKKERILVNYSMSYASDPTKKNKRVSSKNFKIADTVLTSEKDLICRKRHPMRMMSTKTLYPGLHTIDVRINGVSHLKYSFELI